MSCIIGVIKKTSSSSAKLFRPQQIFYWTNLITSLKLTLGSSMKISSLKGRPQNLRWQWNLIFLKRQIGLFGEQIKPVLWKRLQAKKARTGIKFSKHLTRALAFPCLCVNCPKLQCHLTAYWFDKACSLCPKEQTVMGDFRVSSIRREHHP